jgi:hypothetical protein
MSQLILVQNDGVYFPVKRKGRFALELQAAKSPAHRQAAAKKAWEFFRNTMALQGFESLDSRPEELRGPLPHLDVSEDMTVDPGSGTRPAQDASPETLANWELAERARLDSVKSFRQGATPDLVDLILIGRFRKRVPVEFHTAASKGHTR